MDLAALNRAEPAQAAADLLSCCASQSWSTAMTARRPFADVANLLQAAADEWWVLDESDWLEAFAAHPRIGEHRDGEDRHSTWSRDEQAGVAAGGTSAAVEVAECNAHYEERFGYRFLICATGLGAEEMLDACRRRVSNDPDEEILVAAAEQEKITALRLRKLLGID
jgi:OHCU decarboxylase